MAAAKGPNRTTIQANRRTDCGQQTSTASTSTTAYEEVAGFRLQLLKMLNYLKKLRRLKKVDICHRSLGAE